MERSAGLALLTVRRARAASRAGLPTDRRRYRLRGQVAVVVGLMWAPVAVQGQTLTQDEALRLAFADADTIERHTAYLDSSQLALAAQLAGPEVEVETGVVPYYVAMKSGEAIGVAYFDAHRVRTLPEVLMIVVGPDHRIRRVEVVRFAEPPDYRPPEGWLRQFPGRQLDAELSHRRGIANITGATLTARSVSAAARRVLALHRIIAPFDRGDR